MLIFSCRLNMNSLNFDVELHEKDVGRINMHKFALCGVVHISTELSTEFYAKMNFYEFILSKF